MTTARRAQETALPSQPRAQAPQQPLPVAAPRSSVISGRVILPLRLFLGASFLLAGLDKLFDPSFLNPAASTYLGAQLASAAPGTPLGGFILNFAVPNATFFGVLVMSGEIPIRHSGIAGPAHALQRADGHVAQSDILPVDHLERAAVLFRRRPALRRRLVDTVAGRTGRLCAGRQVGALADRGAGGAAWARYPRRTRSADDDPANFLFWAAGIAAVTVAATGFGWGLLHRGQTGATAAPGPRGSAGPPTPAAAATNVPAPGATLIANAGAVPMNGSIEFNLPDGSPAVLLQMPVVTAPMWRYAPMKAANSVPALGVGCYAHATAQSSMAITMGGCYGTGAAGPLPGCRRNLKQWQRLPWAGYILVMHGTCCVTRNA